MNFPSPHEVPRININTALSPQGHIRTFADYARVFSDSESVAYETANRILAAFALGTSAGILHLASKELTSELPAILSFWRDGGRYFLTDLCSLPGLEEQRKNIKLSISEDTAAKIVSRLPPMRGGEYFSREMISIFWAELTAEIKHRLSPYERNVDNFFQELSPSWNLVGRLCFHLAEIVK